MASLPARGGQALYLGVAIPDDELLTDARSIRDNAILVTILVILLALPITYGAARLVSRPIRELAREAAAIRRFDFAGEAATRSVVREVDDLARDQASMKGAVRRFLDIASVMAREPDFERLLPRLVDETVGVVGARAGVLYLARDDGEGLDAASVRDASGSSLPLADAPPGAAMASLVPEDARSGVGRSVGDIGGTGLFSALGADSMAYLAVPLLDRKHDRVGLLVLWFDEAPDRDLVHFVEALSGSAAVSLETRSLIRAQKQLFEAFIQLIAGAIDAKSPYTGGHCARVPELTKMLARAACDATDGPYRNFSLDEEDWEAVHIAAWLHDCGKVTTPEYVVDKATKLEAIHDRIHEIRMRFEVLKRDAEIACWRAVAQGADPGAEQATLAIFAHSPAWVGALMKLRGVFARAVGLKHSDMQSGAQPRGIFNVRARHDNEIVIGDDDSHLNFRISVLPAGEADAATAISRLQQTMTALQASQASFAKLASLNLFDLIR